MYRLVLPTSEEEVRTLRVGDEVSLYGTMLTARDAGHKLMVEKWPAFIADKIKDGAIYHCGPVALKKGEHWDIVAAGPTTSIRQEPYTDAVLKHYGARVIIGKGGMGAKTLAACKEVGAVYVAAITGAPLLADKIIKVKSVHMLSQLGIPEAFWEFEVHGFQGVVTMDSLGQSMHETVLEDTLVHRNRLLGL